MAPVGGQGAEKNLGESTRKGVNMSNHVAKGRTVGFRMPGPKRKNAPLKDDAGWLPPSMIALRDQLRVAYAADTKIWFELSKEEWARLNGTRAGSNPVAMTTIEPSSNTTLASVRPTTSARALRLRPPRWGALGWVGRSPSAPPTPADCSCCFTSPIVAADHIAGSRPLLAPTVGADARAPRSPRSPRARAG